MNSIAYSNDNKELIYRAYISDNMSQWKNLIDKLEKSTNKTNAQIFELLNYQYGYIAWCLGNDKDNDAKKYLDLAENNLQILEKKSFKPSMLNAYKSAFYGFRIGLAMWRAPFIGPKSSAAAKRAVELDAQNWFAYVQLGNIDFYTPSIMGGSKSEAIKHYQKALDLFESSENRVKNWNYLSLLTIIAQAYEEIGDFAEAEKFYKRILSVEPQFGWVRNKLYPEFKKKMKDK